MKHIFFLIAFGLLASCSIQTENFVFRNDYRPEYSKTIKVDELDALGIANFTIIDVRLREDLAKEPDLISSAIHHDPEKITKWAVNLPTDKPLVVYCVKGKWVSQKAATYLNERGFDVYSLEGGINAWSAAMDRP